MGDAGENPGKADENQFQSGSGRTRRFSWLVYSTSDSHTSDSLNWELKLGRCLRALLSLKLSSSDFQSLRGRRKSPSFAALRLQFLSFFNRSLKAAAQGGLYRTIRPPVALKEQRSVL